MTLLLRLFARLITCFGGIQIRDFLTNKYTSVLQKRTRIFENDFSRV